MTATERASNLTQAELVRVWDEFKRVVYVHPDDAQHKSLAVIRATGVEVEEREHMPKGYAFLRETDVVAIIELDKAEAYVAPRTI